MKKRIKTIAVVLALFTGFFAMTFSASAQDADSTSTSEGSVDVGVDVYSRYVWRGTQFGNAPSMQPWVEYSKGGFYLGAWGAYQSDGVGDEADLYIGYSFDFGLDICVTDYFFPGVTYADYENNHYIEAAIGYSISDFSLTVAKFIGGGDDESLYAEVGYSFDKFDVVAGFGDNVYSTTGEFEGVNLGISSSKEVEITDKYSLPISGSVVYNPQAESIFFVAGISF